MTDFAKIPDIEPIWLTTARKYIGQSETKGSKHNPLILKWWSAIRAPFSDDETPWCAGFVGGVLEECGIKSSRSARARSYETWGIPIAVPILGAVAVLDRGPRSNGKGHVTFIAGRHLDGRLMGLGGNQGDSVNIKPFEPSRVISYRMPSGVNINPAWHRLPITKESQKSSNDEA